MRPDPLILATCPQVLYASKPQATGGPYRSGLGTLLLPGQVPTQALVRPDTVVNTLSYRALGFVPGSVTQQGEVKILDGSTLQVRSTPGGCRAEQSRWAGRAAAGGCCVRAAWWSACARRICLDRAPAARCRATRRSRLMLRAPTGE